MPRQELARIAATIALVASSLLAPVAKAQSHIPEPALSSHAAGYSELKLQLADNPERSPTVDPNQLKRNWGPTVNGVRADVTLDKEQYWLGEDIPLHIALQNVSATVPVYGSDVITERCNAVEVVVRDGAGNPLTEFWHPDGGRVFCTGSAGLMHFPLGKIVPVEMSLSILNQIPAKPGKYTVNIKWITVDGTRLVGRCEHCGGVCAEPSCPKEYATASSSASFEVVAASQ